MKRLTNLVLALLIIIATTGCIHAQGVALGNNHAMQSNQNNSLYGDDNFQYFPSLQGSTPLVVVKGNLTVTGTCSGCGGPGSGVSSVDMTVPAVFTVSGTPINASNPSGVIALGVAGTSGGVWCFDSATTVASSPLLANHGLMLGGGAGNCPSALTDLGTTVKLLHGNASGNPTWSQLAIGDFPSSILQGTGVKLATVVGSLVNGNCLAADANQNIVDNGNPCGSGGGGGTVSSVNGSVPGGFSISGGPITTTGTLAIAANGTSGGILCYTASNVSASSALLGATDVLVGGGAGACPTATGVTIVANNISTPGTIEAGVGGSDSSAATFNAPTHFADLGSPTFPTLVDCDDCTSPSNVCMSGGSGALAFWNGATWKCY